MQEEIKTRKCKKDGCTSVPRDPSQEYCYKHKSRKKQIKTTQEDLNKLSSQFTKSSGRSKSHFFITISPNSNPDNKEKTELFAQLVNYLYHEENIKDFFKCKKDKPIIIHSIKIIPGPLEIGEKHNLLNQHTTIDVQHDNVLQVDITKLREFCDQVMGSGCHINVATPKNEQLKMESKMENYANKGISDYNNNNS